MTILDAIESIKYRISHQSHVGFYDYCLRRLSKCGTLAHVVFLTFADGKSDSDHTFVLRKTIYDENGTYPQFADTLSIQDIDSADWEIVPKKR